MLSLLNSDSDDEQPKTKTKEKMLRRRNFLSKVQGLLGSETETRISEKLGGKNQSKEPSKLSNHNLKKPITSKASSKAASENADTKPRSDGALRAKLLSMLDAESDIETTFGKPTDKKESLVEKKRADSNKSTSSTKPKSRESSAGSEKKSGNPSSFRSKTQALLHDDSEKKATPKKQSKSDNPPAHSTNPKSKTQPTLKKRGSSAIAKDPSRVPSRSNTITKDSHEVDDDPPKSSFFSKMQAALESETDSSSPLSRQEKSPDSAPEQPRAKRPNSADKRGTGEKGFKVKPQGGLPKDQPNHKNSALRRPQTSRTQLNDHDESHAKLNPTGSALNSEKSSKSGSDYHESVDSMSDDDSKHAHKASRAVASPPHPRPKEVKKPTPTSKQTLRQQANSSDLVDSDGSEPRYKTHSAAKTKDGNAHVPRNGNANRGKSSPSDSREENSIRTQPKQKVPADR
ncbi:hypothetical protein HDU77_007530 [Chytriomyces hyalinus]|nr:hypothetical protein HDU77_007530 [Chytriomyces hyalinus]